MRKSAALRARGGPSKLQPARSMPLDYRYSPGAASPPNGATAGGGPAANGVGRRAAAEEKEGEVVRMERDDADSPYSSKAVTAEEDEEEEVGERGGGEDEVDSAATATPRRLSPRAATSPKEGDARWGDTSSYGAKKVGCLPSISLMLLKCGECRGWEFRTLGNCFGESMADAMLIWYFDRGEAEFSSNM